ncbi:hypothetical protein AJ78_03957 [Emergomyces pasteurianus Ep9510]|uniref:Helicase ATP-binding domain-containing protein n=1 Tax=Emergomyces pasteurianus Ep9510 TaxID=1447872 RepID=A0A1J9QI33_9EURO|nr:hypothetical protein AJ78_03957 [Emergomyces pasteurianus Ep9510]
MPLQYPGVYVQDGSWAFINSLSKLCGYIDIPSTREFRQWVAEPEFVTVFTPFADAERDHFGATGTRDKNTKTVEVKRIMRLYRDPVILKRLGSMSNLSEVLGETDAGAMSYLFTIQKLAVEYPKRFPDGIDNAENVFRLICLLKYLLKASGKSRKGKGVQQRDYLAVAPVYYTDDTGTTTTATTAGNPTQGTSGSAGPSPGPALNLDIRPVGLETGGKDTTTNGKWIDPYKIIQSSIEKGILKTNLDLPPLTNKELSALVEELSVDSENISSVQNQNRPRPEIQLANRILTAIEDTEDEKGNDAETERIDEEFRSLNKAINAIGATPPSYAAACQYLHLDPDKPVYENIKIQPWQVTGIAWMVQRETASPVPGGILGDECGLGKTIQTLLLICYRAEMGQSPFKPTLLIVPSYLINNWMEEITSKLPHKFTIILYYGKVGLGSTSDPTRQRCTMDTCESIKRLKSLNSNDRASALTVLLTAYTTWRERYYRLDPHHPEPTEKKAANSGTNARATQSSSAASSSSFQFRPSWQDIEFERVILDEGHAAKNPASKTHETIAVVSASNYWIVTATSMANRVTDLRGYMKLLYRPAFGKTAPRPQSGLTAREVYQNSSSDTDLHILDPDLFSSLYSSGHLKSIDAHLALPKIITLIQLRRVKGMTMQISNDKTIEIGEQVPGYMINTVEIPMTLPQLTRYVQIHSSLIPRLKRRGKPSPANPTGTIYDAGIYRRLRLATLSYGFEDLFNSARVKHEGTLAKDIATWRARPEGGLGWFLSRVIQDPAIPYIPRDRKFIASYLVKITPKFPTLTKIVNYVILNNKSKLLVFTLYPASQFLVDMYFNVLGIYVKCIRGGMPLTEHTAIIADFNNPESSLQALLVSLKTGSQGVNLQYDCWNIVFIDIPPNYSMLMQAIGRCYRLGQLRKQNVWILSGKNSFDRYLEGNLVAKLVPQVIAMSSHHCHAPDLGQEPCSASETSSQKSDDMKLHADGLIRQLLGQGESRLSWNDPCDLGLSDEQFQSIKQSFGTVPRYISQKGDELDMKLLTENSEWEDEKDANEGKEGDTGSDGGSERDSKTENKTESEKEGEEESKEEEESQDDTDAKSEEEEEEEEGEEGNERPAKLRRISSWLSSLRPW